MKKTKLRSQLKSDTQERILCAAAGLFARYGYRATSTRDIATSAALNEVTIYRHYPRKRDLYIAVLETELQKITLRGDLLAQIAAASDARSALTKTYDLISCTLGNRRNLVRLLQFGSLDLQEDFDPMLRQNLGELLEVVSGYLDPWVARGELRCSNSKSLVLALIAIILSHQSLHRIFSTEAITSNAMFEAYIQTRMMGSSQ